jgi:hypothetical protein
MTTPATRNSTPSVVSFIVICTAPVCCLGPLGYRWRRSVKGVEACLSWPFWSAESYSFV